MTDHAFDMAVYAAALERLHNKVQEEIRFFDHNNGDVAQDSVRRQRLVTELEAVSWAQEQLRKASRT